MQAGSELSGRLGRPGYSLSAERFLNQEVIELAEGSLIVGKPVCVVGRSRGIRANLDTGDP